MTWTLTATGSADNADDEQFVIDDLRQALTSEVSGTTAATISTAFHGAVDLLAPTDEDTAEDDGTDSGP